MLDKLQAASFRGVTFLIDSSSTTGGRKTVTHEYPQADRRFVEDLGKMQETFSLTGTISGNNYIQDRDALIFALNEPGLGELIHPFFGSVQVTAKPYSLSENLTTLGIAQFSMTFDKSDESIFPTRSLNNTSLINRNTNLLATQINSDFSTIFSVSAKYPLNFRNAQEKLLKVSSSLGINADNFLKVTDNISIFSSDLLTFTTNINDNITAPVNLANEFQTLFSSFSQIGQTAEDQIDLLSRLFGFGSDDATIQETTIIRVEREKNRKIINSAVNSSALIYAYNTVPQLTLSTEDDIKILQDSLDDQFDYLIDNNNLTDDTIQEIKDLKVEVTKYLESAAVNTFKVSTVYTHEIPMTILGYQYYGNVDKTQTLLDLNSTIDSSFVDGNVNILIS